MISETLEPFFNAGLVVLIWAFVVSLWVFAHGLIKDNTRFGNKINTPDLEEYAIAGLVIVVLCAMTFIVLMWTLSVMGV
jgi:hypothetical protein